jgi:hypothetical protein
MISFSNATGNLFNRLGKCGLSISQMRINQSAQLQNLTNTTTGIVAQFNAESDIQAIVGSAYISQLNSDSIGNLASQVADQTINRMVFRDNPQISLTLTQLNTLTSINEVIRQMKIAGATILQQTVSSIPQIVSNPGPNFTGVGNGIVITSVNRPTDGLILQNIFAETTQILCTQDSYIGGATAGNEGLTITGTGAASPFDFNWPLGSNATNFINAIDGSQDNASGNILTNSGFDTYTIANTPDNWDIIVGTPGTNIFAEASLTYGPGESIQFLGNGVTQIQLEQEFGNSQDGTSGTLLPLTQYSVCLFMRRDGNAATGILTVDLIDQNSNVITDAAGNNNSFTIDLSTLTTNYAAFTGVFRTPIILPTSQYFRFTQTTPYTNGASFYLDRMGMGVMTQLSTWEPFYSVHSGSVNLIQGDYAWVFNSNSRGAGGTLNTFQTLLFRMFSDVQTSEIIFPYSATPTISDTLIG